MKKAKESILKGEAAFARKLHAQKETTGRIINHPPSEAYAEGWDRVFGKRDELQSGPMAVGPPITFEGCRSCLERMQRIRGQFGPSALVFLCLGCRERLEAAKRKAGCE